MRCKLDTEVANSNFCRPWSSRAGRDGLNWPFRLRQLVPEQLQVSYSEEYKNLYGENQAIEETPSGMDTWVCKNLHSRIEKILNGAT